MTKQILAYLGSFSVATALFLIPFTAAAAYPLYSANTQSNNGIQITISGGDAYSMVNFYARQNGGTWTTIANAGRTDQFGYFSGLLYAGFNVSAGAIDTYVTVNNQASVTITLGNNTCQFNCSGSSVTFSNANPFINQGQSVAVYATNANGSPSLYLSSNSNGNVVSSYISGTTITLYGNSAGTSTLTFCSVNNINYNNGSNCGTLYVTVGSVSSFVTITPSTLTQPTLNQFYSASLFGQGGTSPYTFSLISGALPLGMSLSATGYLSGAPNNGGNYNFTVQARDTFGRIGTQSYFMTVTGNVLGASTYSNGTLLADNGTIYIIYRNTKLGFTNYPAFTGYGFSIANLTYGSSGNLAMSPYLLENSGGFHPWGTWIKSGNTVYFMHENGLIPVGSYDVFLNNGGQNRLVVAANSIDFNRPLLPIMDYNDYRLR